MTADSRSFLQARARVETDRATAAGCVEAALSHSKMAGLYIQRCAAMEGSVPDCTQCDLGERCRCGTGEPAPASAPDGPG